MTENTAHTEDLPVEAAESEAIIGGHSTPATRQHAEHEIAQLTKEGYVEDLCTAKGITMVNPHTHKKITVSFS